MMITVSRSILFLPLFLLVGCSNGKDNKAPEPSSKEHVFSDQSRALEKAKEVEQVIQIGVDKQRQAIEEQSQ